MIALLDIDATSPLVHGVVHCDEGHNATTSAGAPEPAMPDNEFFQGLATGIGSDSCFHANLRETLAQLAQLRDLESNWDSYGAEPISGTAIDEALKLLFSLQESLYASRIAWTDGLRIKPSCISPLNDGGVQMEWDGIGSSIEVEISPDRSLEYLLVEGRGESRRFLEVEDASESKVIEQILRVVTW